MGGAPIISDEAGVSIGEPHYADDDSAGDNTILGDGAVLTENEIEEVLGDAFAEANQLVPSLSARGCTALVGDSPEEEQVARVSPRPNTTHEVFVGDEPPIEKSAVGVTTVHHLKNQGSMTLSRLKTVVSGRLHPPSEMKLLTSKKRKTSPSHLSCP